VAAPPAGRKPPTKVVDLMQALQASLQARPPARAAERATTRKAASSSGRRPAARRRAS